MRPLYVAKQGTGNGVQEMVTPGVAPSDNKDTNSKTKIKSIQGQTESKLPVVSAAYMPYLSFSKYAVGPITDEQKERKVLFEKLLQAYKDDALHRSATLDESYYQFGPDRESKKDQDDRNKTQVVTKYLKGEKGESDDAFTLIRVKQLWVWTILDEWVITATSHAVDEDQEDKLSRDFLNHPAIREQIIEAASQPKFAARIATLIANYCADATGSQKNDNPDKLGAVIKGASYLACGIKDLRDELNILRSIVNFQETVQRDMAGNVLVVSQGSTTGRTSKKWKALPGVHRRV
ncbi:hypothetical protein FGADI_2731 [Fusarium gaditjirri]|uniref:Uncharacterized protein n=1 Tax=Fusarium gaditjirri TaxID=282569 RepID=A0A8H4X108_9HYPO|nr:hypothetical protein FGADI_2731 [Fusarium gaditjirri]